MSAPKPQQWMFDVIFDIEDRHVGERRHLVLHGGKTGPALQGGGSLLWCASAWGHRQARLSLVAGEMIHLTPEGQWMGGPHEQGMANRWIEMGALEKDAFIWASSVKGSLSIPDELEALYASAPLSTWHAEPDADLPMDGPEMCADVEKIMRATWPDDVDVHHAPFEVGGRSAQALLGIVEAETHLMGAKSDSWGDVWVRPSYAWRSDRWFCLFQAPRGSKTALDAGDGPKQAMWIPVSQAMALLGESIELANQTGLLAQYRKQGVTAADLSDLISIRRRVEASDFFRGDADWNGWMRSVGEREQLGGCLGLSGGASVKSMSI